MPKKQFYGRRASFNLAPDFAGTPARGPGAARFFGCRLSGRGKDFPVPAG
jgi:hypothetical protein